MPSASTVKEIEHRLSEIRAVAHDDERAHALEDALFIDVLTEIMNRFGGPTSRLAWIALKSRDIDFSRWTA